MVDVTGWEREREGKREREREMCACVDVRICLVLSLGFSTRSSKNSGWDPKRAKLDQNYDFGHVRTCQGLPGAQVLVSKAGFLFFSFRN